MGRPAGWPTSQLIDRVEKRRPSQVTMAVAPRAPAGVEVVRVPQRAVLSAAAAGCLPCLAAKAAVACTLGLGIRHMLERIDADFDFPAEAMDAPTTRQRQNAVNTLSGAACLIFFLLLV